MSAIAATANYSAPFVYARPATSVAHPRPATLGASRLNAALPANPGAAIGSSAQGRALAALGDALAGPAAVSNALAIADDHLSRLGELLGSGSGHSSAIDRVVDAASFAGKPLLDGSFTAEVNRKTLPIPSFRAADLPPGALEQVATVRQQIQSFQADAVRPLVMNARSSAETLVKDGPTVDDASAAATMGLLLRAKVLVQSGRVAESASAHAENVLLLIR